MRGPSQARQSRDALGDRNVSNRNLLIEGRAEPGDRGLDSRPPDMGQVIPRFRRFSGHGVRALICPLFLTRTHAGRSSANPDLLTWPRELQAMRGVAVPFRNECFLATEDSEDTETTLKCEAVSVSSALSVAQIVSCQRGHSLLRHPVSDGHS